MNDSSALNTGPVQGTSTAGEWIETPVKIAIMGFAYKGLFAVHESLTGWGYVITHIPSGYSMGARFDLPEDARAATERVYRAYAGWETATPDDVKNMGREAKAAIRAALEPDRSPAVK